MDHTYIHVYIHAYIHTNIQPFFSRVKKAGGLEHGPQDSPGRRAWQARGEGHGETTGMGASGRVQPDVGQASWKASGYLQSVQSGRDRVFVWD